MKFHFSSRRFRPPFRVTAGWLVFLLLLPIWTWAQTPEAGTSSQAVNAESALADPQTRLEAIKTRRTRLAEQLTQVQRALSDARAAQNPERAEPLERRAAVLQQIDGVYAQQALALQHAMSLEAERRQYLNGMQKLAESAPTEAVTFAELERAHEELDSLAARKSTLTAKLKQTETLYAQAKQSLKDKQAAQERLESSLTQEARAGTANEALAAARSQTEFARETLTLREIEKGNISQALAATASQRDLLEKRLAWLEQKAVFGKEELKNQLQETEKDEFALKRQLAKATDFRSSSSARLAEALERLARLAPDQQQTLSDEVDAKRLADEAAKVKIDTLTRRIELLADWKTVWQRRYAVFNNVQNHANWLKWKQEATDKIDTIDQEQRLISLWLNDWQKQLITLQNELAGLTDRGAAASRWIELQRQSVQKIIEAHQEQNTFLENTRRHLQKLIDRITERTAHRSWREWAQLALDYELYGIRLGHWLSTLATAIGLFVLFVFVRNTLITRLQVHAEADDARIQAMFFASVRRTTTFFLLMISLALAVYWHSLDPSTNAVIKHSTMVALILQSAIWASYFCSSYVRNYLGSRAKRDKTSKGALSIFNFASQAAVWSIALLLILQNIGIDVTALATGLGIGGVAVALALQRILGDLFSSLSIVLDKPFVAGDFIIVDQMLGTVEHIGIKTTRIRSLDGEQIICANSDLLETRIRNFQRMKERRVVFHIGVVYQTPARQLARIPQMLREIVESQTHTRCDRAHFKSFGDFALLYEVVYYVNGPDYNLYMDIQQAINLAIFERFQAEGIEFAYPTQSVYLQRAMTGDLQPALHRAERLDEVAPALA